MRPCQTNHIFRTQEWVKDRSVGYHRRRLYEAGMHRMKTCAGDHLKNHLLRNQHTEARPRNKTLNKFTHLGIPWLKWI